MRYRIKCITYRNGRKVYQPQKKTRWGWTGIWYGGTVSILCDDECATREHALERIDKNFEGNEKVQTIEFEHINK